MAVTLYCRINKAKLFIRRIFDRKYALQTCSLIVPVDYAVAQRTKAAAAMSRQPMMPSSRSEQLKIEFTDPQEEKKDVIRRQDVAEENPPEAVTPAHTYSGNLYQYLTEAQRQEGQGKRSSFKSTVETSNSSGQGHQRHSRSINERTFPSQLHDNVLYLHSTSFTSLTSICYSSLSRCKYA